MDLNNDRNMGLNGIKEPLAAQAFQKLEKVVQAKDEKNIFEDPKLNESFENSKKGQIKDKEQFLSELVKKEGKIIDGKDDNGQNIYKNGVDEKLVKNIDEIIVDLLKSINADKKEVNPEIRRSNLNTGSIGHTRPLGSVGSSDINRGNDSSLFRASDRYRDISLRSLMASVSAEGKTSSNKSYYDAPTGPAVPLKMDGLGDVKLTLTEAQKKELGQYKEVFIKNKARYDKVSQATGLPAEAIWALHAREGSCSFNTYLHNGDPLGLPTTHVPKGICFNNWEEAAIDAIKREKPASCNIKPGETPELKDVLKFAEKFNGLGYRGKEGGNPYIFAGTDRYQSGKYVSDGVYNPNVKDKQLGVVALLSGVS